MPTISHGPAWSNGKRLATRFCAAGRRQRRRRFRARAPLTLSTSTRRMVPAKFLSHSSTRRKVPAKILSHWYPAQRDGWCQPSFFPTGTQLNEPGFLSETLKGPGRACFEPSGQRPSHLPSPAQRAGAPCIRILSRANGPPICAPDGWCQPSFFPTGTQLNGRDSFPRLSRAPAGHVWNLRANGPVICLAQPNGLVLRVSEF